MNARPEFPEVTHLVKEAMPNLVRSPTLGDDLTEILTEATALVNAESGDVVLRDVEKGVHRVVAVVGGAATVVSLGLEYPLSDGCAARTSASKRTLILKDYQSYRHRARAFERCGIKALMSSPLVARGNVIGALAVGSKSPGFEFTQHDARVLSAFTSTAALAIDNAQRYHNEARLARKLTKANNELNHHYNVQRQLIVEILTNRGPDALAVQVADVLESPVVLQDAFLRVIAGASPLGTDDWSSLALPTAQVNQPELRRFLLGLVSGKRPALYCPKPGNGPDRVVVPIMKHDHDEPWGYLVLPWLRRASEIDSDLVQVAAAGIALQFLLISARVEVEQTLSDDLVRDLLTQTYSDEDLILARASNMGYDLMAPRDVIVVRVDDLRDVPVDMVKEEARRLNRIVCDLIYAEVATVAPASMVMSLDDGVVVLAAQCSRDAHGYGSREPALIVKRYLALLNQRFPELSFSAAVGDRCSKPADYAASFDLAQRALDAMWKLGKRGCVIDARELGMYRIILSAVPNEELLTYVAAMLEPLARRGVRGQELLSTLDAYIASGFNKRSTARRSFLHINTVANRLRRIEAELGKSLDDPNVLIELAFALRLGRAIGLVPPNPSSRHRRSI